MTLMGWGCKPRAFGRAVSSPLPIARAGWKPDKGSRPEVRHLVDGSAWVPKKGVASCDKPGLGACSRRPPDA
jgi:hypothetical protein